MTVTFSNAFVMRLYSTYLRTQTNSLVAVLVQRQNRPAESQAGGDCLPLQRPWVVGPVGQHGSDRRWLPNKGMGLAALHSFIGLQGHKSATIAEIDLASKSTEINNFL